MGNSSNAHMSIANLRENANVTENQHVYPHFGMQNTIASLTGATDSLKQQLLSMHARQETIKSTLEQVLSALQQLRGYNHSSLQNQDSSTVGSLTLEVGGDACVESRWNVVLQMVVLGQTGDLRPS